MRGQSLLCLREVNVTCVTTKSVPGMQGSFPGLFFYVYIESPSFKKNQEGSTTQAPNPID